jgi:hypothetical protein
MSFARELYRLKRRRALLDRAIALLEQSQLEQSGTSPKAEASDASRRQGGGQLIPFPRAGFKSSARISSKECQPPAWR